ncbi:hypothetical protein C8A03DRAFT_35715 [Achaetomium macrosporum]|uniref:Uncharacterized protein n=1 Tax=Achaetomium macrosporum TaxID=79813 RepID=A0AAN7C7W1_9PEZI|nr:hypothetical protein C8A03DRAFT_35715 [Achaetomium macrosporum]
MEDDHSLPPSTAAEMIDDMTNPLPPLYHLPEGSLSGQDRPADRARRLEATLVPVTDCAFARLAKECADLYDKFVATATPNPSPPGNNNYPFGNNGQNPVLEPETDSILHISKREFTTFIALFHHLAVTPLPHGDLVERELKLGHEQDLLSREREALKKREEDVTRREAALATMRDDEDEFNRQLRSMFSQGHDAGYKMGFEFGRRKAMPLTYQLHISALEEIHRRIREITDRCERLGARGMGGRGGMVAELERLQTAVEFLVRKTCAAAGEKGLDLEDLMRMVGVEVTTADGRGERVDYREFLRMAERRKRKVTDGEERMAMERERQKRKREMARARGEDADVEMGEPGTSGQASKATTTQEERQYPAAFWSRAWEDKPRNDGPQFGNLPSSDVEFENSD